MTSALTNLCYQGPQEYGYLQKIKRLGVNSHARVPLQAAIILLVTAICSVNGSGLSQVSYPSWGSSWLRHFTLSASRRRGLGKVRGKKIILQWNLAPAASSVQWIPRGGDSSSATGTGLIDSKQTNNDNGSGLAPNKVRQNDDELSLDDRVQRALERLGLVDDNEAEGGEIKESVLLNKELHSQGEKIPELESECKDGVCSFPQASASSPEQGSIPPTVVTTESKVLNSASSTEDAAPINNSSHMPSICSSIAEAGLPLVENDGVIAEGIIKQYNVSRPIALAALAAGGGDVSRAKDIISYQIGITSGVPDDSHELNMLQNEGWNTADAKRSLALSDMNIDDARAILHADAEDEEEAESATRDVSDSVEEDEGESRAEAEAKMTRVNVPANFDPVSAASSTAQSAPQARTQGTSPASPQLAAKKSDVVFDVTAETLQKLVIESPVPVLLDCYADWCGPCKALTPALEQMAMKSGGIFRLCKLNTDEERSVSQLLGVTALPTVYGIRKEGGQIMNSFQGMPQSEEQMKSFLISLVMNTEPNNPALTDTEKTKYMVLSAKLIKMAGMSSLSFSAREKLHDYITSKLDELAKERSGDMSAADESASLIRTMLLNIINYPSEEKFRSIKLDHPLIDAKIGRYSSCRSILRSIGFASREGGDTMKAVFGEGKAVVNVARLTVARDAIGKWSDNNRYKISAAARKRKDEEDHAELLRQEAKETAKRATTSEVNAGEDAGEELIDVNACEIKLRIDGKKKVFRFCFDADESIGPSIMTKLSTVGEVHVGDKALPLQVTCAGRRLVIKSDDVPGMRKTFREHGLVPTANLVVKIAPNNKEVGTQKVKKRSLSGRADVKKRKKGSHTMQSVGIYSKDDNAKGELIDGGGGVLYEHDVTDSEHEEEDRNDSHPYETVEDEEDTVIEKEFENNEYDD